MIFFAFKDGEKQLRVLKKLHVSHFSEINVTYLQLSLKFSNYISFQIWLHVRISKIFKKRTQNWKKVGNCSKKLENSFFWSKIAISSKISKNWICENS